MTAESLEHVGVQAVIVDRSAGAAATPCKTSPAEGEIILRLHRHPKDGAHVLGDAIVGGDAGPNTIATVYAAAIAERSRHPGHAPRDDRRPRLAHEIGHLLLGTKTHMSHGLMRPSWQLQRLDRGDWDFTLEDAAAIRARLKRRDAAALLARAVP